MKIGTVTAIATLIITICGIFVWFGQFVGTTNTSVKFLSEKITVVASDVKDIKSILIAGDLSGKKIAKGD